MSITYNSKSIVGVSESNNAVIKGNLFQASYKFTIPAGDTYNLTYKTPVGLSVEAYPTVLATSADNLTLEFRENAVVSGGTVHQAFNQNRKSDRVSEMELRIQPTITNEGDKVAQVFLPGAVGQGQTRSGSQGGGGDNRWILKEDTTYLFKFINGSSSSNTVQINEIWIER